MAEINIYTEEQMPFGMGKILDLLPLYQEVHDNPEGSEDAMEEIREALHTVCPPRHFEIGEGASALPDFGSVGLRLEDDPGADTGNIARFHGAYRSLPPSLAAIPGFWAWLAHAHYWQYVVCRAEEDAWQLTPKNKEKHVTIETKLSGTIRRDFFCHDDSTPGKSLLVNPLSRLWWAGYFFRDDANVDDPYAYARLLTETGQGSFASLFVLFASSAASRSHAVALGILSALDKWNQVHDECFKEQSIRGSLLLCTTYLNQIGAMRMVDMLDRNEIKEILLRKLEKKFPRAEAMA